MDIQNHGWLRVQFEAPVTAQRLQHQRMNMRANERPVVQQKARDRNRASNNLLRVLIEILVVWATRRADAAENRNQGGLALAPGASGALGVVGGRRRHIAHIDGGKLADVDAQFHRGRADQRIERVAGLAEALFNLPTVLAADLGAVFLRFHAHVARERAQILAQEVAAAKVFLTQAAARGASTDAQRAVVEDQPAL